MKKIQPRVSINSSFCLHNFINGFHPAALVYSSSVRKSSPIKM